MTAAFGRQTVLTNPQVRLFLALALLAFAVDVPHQPATSHAVDNSGRSSPQPARAAADSQPAIGKPSTGNMPRTGVSLTTRARVSVAVSVGVAHRLDAVA
jgi:hypothetical protein